MGLSPDLTECHDEFYCLVAEPLSVEARFGLKECRPRGADSHCDVELGKWSSSPGGGVQLGALAIAADHILGEVPYIRRAHDQWSLTTELTIDFVVPPEPGTTLHIWGSPTRIETTGGFAHGEMINAEGGVVALCTTRTLFVPSSPIPPPAELFGATSATGVTTAVTLDEHLGLDFLDGGDDTEELCVRMIDPSAWQNNFGILHGGVWACLAEVAASRLVARTRPGLATASIHTTYLRPGAPGAPVSVTARTFHVGGSLAVIECVGRSGDGAICTRSTVTARRVGHAANG